MTRPQIRIRASDDLELVADLDRQAFNGDCPLDESELNTSQWWIAEVRQDGAWEPVAYAGAELNDAGQLVLTRAGVLPVARGAGLQRRLVAVRERWGRARGARVAVTYTHWANVRSQRSLIRCGYLPNKWWVEADGKLGVRFINFQKNLDSRTKAVPTSPLEVSNGNCTNGPALRAPEQATEERDDLR